LTPKTISVSNGTMADAVAVAALKVTYPKIQKVLVPALTFIAQPNSVRYSNLEVVFADVNEDWTIDVLSAPQSLQTLIFGTDLMGRQCLEGMDIEDACESFESRTDGKAAGTFAELGTYSFFPFHTISTGEGGAIVTNDPELDRLCRSIRAHGSISTDPMDKFHFPHPGFNARLTSLQAVLGISLMKHVDEYIRQRRYIFSLLQSVLGGFYERPGEEIVPHGYPVEFVSESARDAAMQKILAAGIECRKFFSCIPLEEKSYLTGGRFPVATHISHTHLYLPCHQNMVADDARYMLDVVLEQQGRVFRLAGQKV
jgi:perosamine synthetase